MMGDAEQAADEQAAETEVGAMWTAALAGGRRIGERYWREKGERGDIAPRIARIRAMYAGGQRRAPTAAERATGIPAGWFGR